MAYTNDKKTETESMSTENQDVEKVHAVRHEEHEEHEEVLAAAHETVVVDHSLFRRIARKTDIHLLILLVVINIFNFIDRANIGNARILGMQKELKLTGDKYNLAVMFGSISIIFVEIPSNIACKKVGASLWIPMSVTGFSIITILVSVVQNAGGLYAIRFFLGAFESGVSPAIVWLLSQFYLREELGLRIALYISAAGSSGAFGGLFAIGLSKIPKWGMIHTWRNIYFFEGIISLILGIISWFVIPNGPRTARFLNEEEKETAENRLLVDAAGTNEHGRTKLKHVFQAFKSPHVLGCSFGFCAANIAQTALSVFSPTIINGFGYSATTTQLLSVGPYGLACVLSILLGYVSDRFKCRSLVIIGCLPLALAGFLMLRFVSVHHPWVKYGAVCIALPPLYTTLPLWMAWCVNNCATPTVRASASGILFVVGSGFSGLIAPWVYLSTDAPTFPHGNSTMCGMISLSLLIAIVLRLYCQWENRQRNNGKRDHILQGLTPDQEMDLSSKHPAFRYIL